ncbi:MAG: hypothetical protein GY906_22855 [bacterium]|nr:hypothetical protein [bacterium]
MQNILPFPNPFLGLLPKDMWGRTKDYFTYSRDFVGANALAPGATLGLTFAINGDSDFLVVSSTRVVTLIDDTTFIAQAPILALITDSGSGRNLSDQPIHVESYFGTGQEPAYWDMTKIIPRNSTVAVTLQNLDLVNTYHVRTYFSGFKVFGFSGGAQSSPI